jgi:uncharacterized membrane protein YtjA (UPF0391 family)
MKYLFIAIKRSLLLVLLALFWAVCQLLILVWHFNFQHNQLPKPFYQSIEATLSGEHLLPFTVIFLVFTVICAVFGFGSLAPHSEGIFKVLFYMFLALFVLSLAIGWRSENVAE